MDIPKAIEHNQGLLRQPWLQPFPDDLDAIKMGITALKVVNHLIDQWEFISEELALALRPFLAYPDVDLPNRHEN